MELKKLACEPYEVVNSLFLSVKNIVEVCKVWTDLSTLNMWFFVVEGICVSAEI